MGMGDAKTNAKHGSSWHITYCQLVPQHRQDVPNPYQNFNYEVMHRIENTRNVIDLVDVEMEPISNVRM